MSGEVYFRAQLPASVRTSLALTAQPYYLAASSEEGSPLNISHNKKCKKG